MKIKNKKGFTLMELLAVFALLALVMMLVVPGLSNLSNSNNEKEYKTYEDMMVEYAKTYPKTKYKNGSGGKKYICLKDLDIKNVNTNTDCKGYVEISGNNMKSYISCKNGSQDLYTTTGYSLPSGC